MSQENQSESSPAAPPLTRGMRFLHWLIDGPTWIDAAVCSFLILSLADTVSIPNTLIGFAVYIVFFYLVLYLGATYLLRGMTLLLLRLIKKDAWRISKKKKIAWWLLPLALVGLWLIMELTAPATLDIRFNFSKDSLKRVAENSNVSQKKTSAGLYSFAKIKKYQGITEFHFSNRKGGFNNDYVFIYSPQGWEYYEKAYRKNYKQEYDHEDTEPIPHADKGDGWYWRW